MPRRFCFVLAVTACLVLAAPAHATRPARDCGIVSHGERRYLVREDGVACRSAKDFVVRWLRHRRSPRAWACRSFPERRKRVRLLCERGRRSIIAVRL